MKQDRKLWVYDIETFKNCFTYVGLNIDTKEIVKFVIWNDRNDLYSLCKHLKNVRGLIGFNNLNFDYPVLHYILDNYIWFSDKNAEFISNSIYLEAQEVIQKEYSAINPAFVKIPQLDLYRIWHFDNVARRTSLKKLQIAMRYENVQDIPYYHGDDVLTEDVMLEILEYNVNDVKSTYEFYLKTIPKIDLRKGIYNKYGLKCLNFSDSRIGEQLMLKLYCEATGKDIRNVRYIKTYRSILKFRECIPEHIIFKSNEFKELLDYLLKIEVTKIKNSFKYSVISNGFQFDLGTGGIHGCIKAGVYESDDKYIIIDIDVSSLYPMLPIVNRFYPEHLGEKFIEVYDSEIVKPRLEAKKQGDKVVSGGLKLSANSVYGKSNSKYSWLYDTLYTLKTTLTGQLSLCMLSEQLMYGIDDSMMLQINTDGLTARIPREQENKFYDLCRKWEEETKLELEYINYSKMIVRDVNSYMSVYNNGEYKTKGVFKDYQDMIDDGEWHKAFNQSIVSTALKKFYLNNVPVEKTIMECTNIFDFCKTFNASHGWGCETSDYKIVDTKYEDYVERLLQNGYEEISKNYFKKTIDNQIKFIKLEKHYKQTKVYYNIEQQQKTNRYYISTEGVMFRKYKDVRNIGIEADNTVTIFNNYVQKDIIDYNIDYDYYIKECYKIIHKIDGTEERLEQEKKAEKERLKKEKELNNFVRFCINKSPTERQLKLYGKDWLIEQYGKPTTREALANRVSSNKSKQ